MFILSRPEAVNDLIHAATQALDHPFSSHVHQLVKKAEAYLSERGYGIDPDSRDLAVRKIYESASLTNAEARRRDLSFGADGSRVKKAVSSTDYNLVWVDNYGRHAQVKLAVEDLVAHLKETRGVDLDSQTAELVVKRCPPPAAEEHWFGWLSSAARVAREILNDEMVLKQFSGAVTPERDFGRDPGYLQRRLAVMLKNVTPRLAALVKRAENRTHRDVYEDASFQKELGEVIAQLRAVA